MGALVALLAVGCDLGDGGPRREGVHGDLEGGLLTTRAALYDVVFSIARPDVVNVGLSICSGTLIAPKVLLTAAHCVTVEDDHGYSVENPALFFVSSGRVVDRLDNSLAVDEIVVHPDYLPGTSFADLALIVLEQDATSYSGGQLMPIATQIRAGHLGIPRGVDLVAFGGDEFPEPWAPREQSTSPQRYHLPHELAETGCDVEDPACWTPNMALSWDNSPDAGFCGGGEGGPALIFWDAAGRPAPMPWQYLEHDSPVPAGGSVALAGVLSRVEADEECNGVGVIARADTALDFITPYLSR